MSFQIHPNKPECEKMAKNTKKYELVLKISTFLAILVQFVAIIVILAS